VTDGILVGAAVVSNSIVMLHAPVALCWDLRL